MKSPPPHLHMTQQSPLRLPHISGSSHYGKVDMCNCAGVVCCFGWWLSAAPERPDHCVETKPTLQNKYCSAVSLRPFYQNVVLF